MPRVAFKEADVARLVRGAIKGGLPVGRICVRLIDGAPAVVPIDPVPVPAHVPARDGGAADLDAQIQALIDGDG